MHDIIALEKLGLTKNDRKVYLALLESGSVTVSILVKKTGLHRSYVYDILDKLVDIGLVSSIIKNNKKYFSTENPEKILQILKTRQEEFKKIEREMFKVLQELIRRKNIATEKQEASIFIGKEGIKSILEDILKTGKDFQAFGAEGKFKDIFKWYFDNWQKRRIKMKLKYKIIYSGKMKEKRPIKNQKLIEIRFLPRKYEFPATTIVYGSKVAIVIWDVDPIGFVIESSHATRSFLSYFNLLWSIRKY